MAAGARGRRAAGLALLLCVVLIWVGSSFLVSNLFGEQQYNRPFFVTYVNTGTFSLYLVGAWISHRRSRSGRVGPPKPGASRGGGSSAGGGSGDAASHGAASRDGGPGRRAHEASPLAGTTAEQTAAAAAARLSVRETVRLGVQFAFIWFAANVTQNASLAYTSVASSSILCSTSGLFTLAIGAASGVERFSAARLAAVLASVAGVYCIMQYGTGRAGAGAGAGAGAEAAAAAPQHSWAGDVLALLSAALYGCYVTLLKRRVGDESRLDTPLFFGAVGLANTALLWPGLVALHAAGIERFQLPQTRGVWAMVLVNALVGTFLSDYLWLLAMLMTSPLVVTLGLSLTIPLSVAGDVLVKGLDVAPPYYLGAALVLGAFFVVSV
ncbi:hypothetical protein H4R18_002316 [Coemansia javaensis]|uniref:EamA domain-containing protein n=1 Tax=Coemansia javaensis TaxID=2761396 RepID=A0A9W8HC93_9FUNG|nr:hypothetical protein H4R18_002316 [Coemansia javaensis]